jgi:hypothetical protein
MTRANFYRERDSGDYLAVFPAESTYRDGQRVCDGRATAIAGLLTSVCTTGIGDRYLRGNCTRVRRRQVPADWLKSLLPVDRP